MFVGYCSQIGDVDIFAKRLGLFYNGREKIGSLFGLALTIIYILASFFIFIYYTLSIIKKEELQVNDSTEYSSDVPYINLTILIYFILLLVLKMQKMLLDSLMKQFIEQVLWQKEYIRGCF